MCVKNSEERRRTGSRSWARGDREAVDYEHHVCPHELTPINTRNFVCRVTRPSGRTTPYVRPNVHEAFPISDPITGLGFPVFRMIQAGCSSGEIPPGFDGSTKSVVEIHCTLVAMLR